MFSEHFRFAPNRLPKLRLLFSVGDEFDQFIENGDLMCFVTLIAVRMDKEHRVGDWNWWVISPPYLRYFCN
jgi:hypothetical protein